MLSRNNPCLSIITLVVQWVETYIPAGLFEGVVLGTGQLTIARAIRQLFWGGTRFGKMNLENFHRGKQKKEYCGD